jgi:hypothetical protein
MIIVAVYLEQLKNNESSLSYTNSPKFRAPEVGAQLTMVFCGFGAGLTQNTLRGDNRL